jgi:hypothetical protein
MRDDSVDNYPARTRKRSDPQPDVGLLQWAWEFLRRSPMYRTSYAHWSAAPDELKEHESFWIAAERGDLDHLPVSWFDLEPSPGEGDLFGGWRRKHASQESCLSISDELDPSRFMLNVWLDPGQSALPHPAHTNFFVADLQLEEDRALVRRSNAIDGGASTSGLDLATVPRTIRCPDGSVELRVGRLQLSVDRSSQVALRFDLALPLGMQLASAKRQLLAAREDFGSTSERSLLANWRSKANHGGAWIKMLALLDAREGAKSDADAVSVYLQNLEGSRVDLSDMTDGLLTSLRRARDLSNKGYHGLVMRAFENE